MDRRSGVIVQIDFSHLLLLDGCPDSSWPILGEYAVDIRPYAKKPAPIATVVGIGAGFVESARAEDEMGA
jgi:hypothetical protein